MSDGRHLLGIRDGRLLAAVQLLHAVAQGLTIAVLPWAVLDAGGSVTTAGLVLTATFVPFLALGLPAGLAGDRLSRRSVFTAALAGQTVVALVLVLLAGRAGTPGVVVFAAALLMGCGRVFVDAAMFGALGSLVARDGMLSAQATISSAFNLGYYGGPALGGLLIAVAGVPVALGAIAAATAVGMLAAARLGAPVDARPAAQPGGAAAMSAGLRLLFTEPTLRALALVAVSWSVMSAGIITLAIPHLRQGLGLDGARVGLVMASGVGAMLVAPVLLHRLAPRVRDTRILVAALASYLPPVAVFATAGDAMTAALAYGPLMLATAVCAATIIGARARRTPAHLQALAGVSGRMLVITGFSAGSALASAAAGLVSPATVFVMIGLGMTGLAAGALRGLDLRAAGRARPGRLAPEPRVAART